MKSNQYNSWKDDISGISRAFQQSGDSFFIKAPCIITDNQVINLREIYEFVDLTKSEDFISYVRLVDANRKGFEVSVIVLDIKTGQLIKRSHRLNCDKLPCTWLLISLDYFEKEFNKELVQKYCNEY